MVPVVGPDAVSPEEFKAAFRDHPAGVALVTADDGDGPVALTASSVFSVSVDPPLLVFSIADRSSAAPTLRRADTVVVHLLAADELPLAKLGAARGVDRFADTTQWSRLPTGEPYFLASRSWIRARVASRMMAGGSTVYAVHALETHLEEEAGERDALVYHNRTWHRLSEDSRID